MNRLTFFSIVMLIFVTSCTPDKENASIGLQKEGFNPNPQEIPKQEVTTLSIGSHAPDFNLPGVDGLMHNIAEYKSSDILVVLFSCNHCPTAQAYEDRVIKLVDEYKDKSLQLIAISPNSPNGLLYEELGYSDLSDTYEEMIIRAKDKSYNFPYLYDGDDQKVSLEYGPVATPHVFVFDKNRKLQYQGRIDKSEKPGTANAEDLRAAIDSLFLEKPIEVAMTKTFGCSTKWGWKTEYRVKLDKEWKEKEVTIDEIGKEKITALLENKIDKLRLINIWATWCGPCRLEYPSFIPIQRMFGARNFEFNSISMDQIENKESALKFLQKSHSAVSNYISTIEDKYQFIELIDPNWNGALPFTLLIEPGGTIYWSHQGEVDFQELKRVIVEHPKIGRFY